MRRRMIEETDFGTAVFIGGMAGVLDERRPFAVRAPTARIMPVVSTGGAAEVLEIDAVPEFAEELGYTSRSFTAISAPTRRSRGRRAAGGVRAAPVRP